MPKNEFCIASNALKCQKCELILGESVNSFNKNYLDEMLSTYTQTEMFW